MARAFLYDSEGTDREVPIDAAPIAALTEHSLLWIDVETRDRAEIEHVAALLSLEPRSVRRLLQPVYRPHLDNYGQYFQLSLHAAPPPDGDHKGLGLHADMPRLFGSEDREGAQASAIAGAIKLDFIVGARWILTVHGGHIHFLRAFRAQDKAETMIGALSAPSLAASLLDWHLEGYFEAVAHIEATVDRLDETVLQKPGKASLLAEMVATRRRVSQLRSLLAAQRPIFHGLTRPDLTLVAESDAGSHYQLLGARFERAVDSVEKARDLVVGSFELFATRTAQETNELVKTLTFVTVLLGVWAAIAGIFGMNFDPAFFGTGETGFFTVTGLLLAFAIAAVLVARRRGWL